MNLGNIALGGVLLVGIVYFGVVIAGLVAAWPWGAVGLSVIGFFGFLLGAVLKQRLGDDEDAYYTKTVDK